MFQSRRSLSPQICDLRGGGDAAGEGSVRIVTLGRGSKRAHPHRGAGPVLLTLPSPSCSLQSGQTPLWASGHARPVSSLSCTRLAHSRSGAEINDNVSSKRAPTALAPLTFRCIPGISARTVQLGSEKAETGPLVSTNIRDC